MSRAVEAEPYDRAAVSRRSRPRPAAVRLGDLAHDREAEPRAGHRAGIGRAVEAVEDERPVLVGEPWPVIAHAQLAAVRARPRPSRRPRSTCRRSRAGSRRRAPSGRGSRRRRSARGRRSPTRPRGTACAPARPSSRRARRTGTALFSTCAPPRASSSRPAMSERISCDSRWRSSSSCSPLLGLEHDVAAQDVDVRLQARQRRAQLVRGVGDEAPLRLERLLERGEHRVERTHRGARARRCPPSGTRSLGSPVSAIRSAAAVSRRTGASVAPETSAAGEPQPRRSRRARRGSGSAAVGRGRGRCRRSGARRRTAPPVDPQTTLTQSCSRPCVPRLPPIALTR